MRKTTLSRSLLLTAALTLGATTMTAQTVSPTPVSSPDKLTDGYYVLNIHNHSGEVSPDATGLIYYHQEGNDNQRRYRAIYDFSFENGQITDDRYVWILDWNDEHTAFTLQNAAMPNIYFSLSTNQNNQGRGDMTSGGTTALYEPVAVPDTEGRFYLKVTNPAEGSATPLFVFTNNVGNGFKNISYWNADPQPNANSGGVQMEFFKVSGYTSITYNYLYNGQVVGSETLHAYVGSEFPSPTTLPAFVTGKIPEGTVTAGTTEYSVDCTWDGPFAISESVQNATWYAVGLHTAPYYLHNTEGAESMTLAAEQQTIDASTIEAFDAQMWCFVGNPFDGFKIYNKAAGKGKILSSSTTMSGNGGGTYPILVDEASLPEGNNTTWDVMPSTKISDVNGFYIAQHGIAANKMNRQGEKLTYWTGGADAGSTFRALNITDLYKTEIAPDLREEAQGENVGMFTPDAISAHREAINSLDNGTGTPEQYVEVYNARTKIIPGNYYRIVSGYSQFETQQGVKKAIYNDGTSNIKWGSLDMADADFIFQIEEADEAGKYLIKNANRDLYMAGVKGLLDTKENAISGSGAISLVQLIPGEFNIEFGNGTMHAESHQSGAGTGGALVQWDGGEESGSSWCIVPATTLDVTMNTVDNETWATLYLPFSVKVPESVTAYTGTQKDENTVGLTDVKDGIIPAQTGVVLKGTATTCPLTLTNDAVAPVEGNIFTGTCLPISVTPETLENYYVLSTLEGVIGLYWPQEGTTALAANKAYIDNTPAAGAAGYRFVFGDDTTVGINGAQFGQPSDAPYYDLSGRRVAQPAKGIYIHNGKKVFIK